MNRYIYPIASHSDKGITKRLPEKLEKAGHKVWFGQDTTGDQQERQTEFEAHIGALRGTVTN